nr:hypothetical protein [uncultured Kingella sp.]
MGFQAALVNELGSLKMVLDVVGMNMPCGGEPLLFALYAAA